MAKEKQINNTTSVSTITVKDESDSNHPAKADFETAISATGFGWFNLLLLLTAVPTILVTQFESSSLAFVFPAARCDLNLTFEDRGFVNAILYAGMISSAFLWGFLADIFGRRKILIISIFLESIVALTITLSPNFAMLLVAKFLGGIIINGPSTALTPYLSEFHGTIYRSRVPLTMGFFYSVGNVCLPLLAWLILPLNINISLFNGGFEFHAWNLFLFVSVFPAFISGILFILMPETPKYLMTKGNNDKALKVFQKIYKFNTRLPPETYPVKQLIEENQIQKKRTTVKEAWNQISPLFTSKYAVNLILCCLFQFCLMMCVNSLRLWLPEIFQIVNDYQYFTNETASFCAMLNSMNADVTAVDETCSVNFNNSSVYTNSMIVAFSTMCGYFVTAFLINKLGKKRILCFLGLINGISVASVYFALNPSVALILICIHITCTCICVDVVITVVVDLFPTFLRGSALSLAFMCGRVGSFVGNLVFPFLLQTGCAAPFFTLGCILIGCTILSLFLPNTHLQALQ